MARENSQRSVSHECRSGGSAFAESSRAQGRADDIERVEASNGDVYFYSMTYLRPRRSGLAEWDAVEHIRNV